MKKRIWVLLVAAGLLLSGCHPTPDVQPVTANFTCQAEIAYREMELTAQLTRHTDGSLDITFSRPKSLSDITLGWDGTELSMELGGVRMALPAEKVPESALARCMLQVLSAAHTRGEDTADGAVFTGEVDGKTYELVCDPSTGFPLSLSMPDEALTAVFEEVKILTE